MTRQNPEHPSSILPMRNEQEVLRRRMKGAHSLLGGYLTSGQVSSDARSIAITGESERFPQRDIVRDALLNRATETNP